MTRPSLLKKQASSHLLRSDVCDGRHLPWFRKLYCLLLESICVCVSQRRHGLNMVLSFNIGICPPLKQLPSSIFDLHGSLSVAESISLPLQLKLCPVESVINVKKYKLN